MSKSAFQNHHVTDEMAGFTLAAALRRFRAGDSWSAVHRLIHNRHVQVNGTLCADETRKLKAGDVVKVWQEPLSPPPRAETLRIRYQDRHIVVVEKPAGVTTLRHSEEHNWSSRRKQRQPTLDEMLRVALSRKAAAKSRGKGPKPQSTDGKTKQKPLFIRAVHRLDRDTSGLMVFALSSQAQRSLAQMFRKHDMQRVYVALVEGRVEERTFESNLVRDRGDGLRGATNLPNIGKRAVTHVKPLRFLDGYTLVECRLETGRTHQIRIHLSEAGHPVCGDKVYRRMPLKRLTKDLSGASRQALHALQLGFNHPITGEPLQFEMPLPADLARLIDRLK
jgi:23S rRNA pseudouridine1911/1915/1917 synthase